jgi:hypothetical protein
MTDHVSEIIELDGTRFRHRMISAADVRFHYEETKNLNADMRTPKLRTREQEVVGLLDALRHLDKKLQEQNDIYAQKYKDARAERIE